MRFEARGDGRAGGRGGRIKVPDFQAEKIAVMGKTCLCTHMRNFDCWTCGHYTYRLKDTSRRLADGSYRILDAEGVFRDYQFSTDGRIALPPAEERAT